MKVKLAVFVFLTIIQFSFSQTKKTINGKVLSENLLISNVEIINLSTEKSTTTNANGEFSIAAKINDSILIFHKNYELKGIKISSDDINKNQITVEITRKAEELKEVVVSNAKFQTTWLTKEEIEQIKLNSSRPKQGLKIIDYKESPSLLGVDFIRLGKQFYNLFKKEKTTTTESSKNNFKELAKNQCKPDYFIKNLKLQSEEIELFLDFCEADKNSNDLTNNDLELMDFLYKKSVEFKKINAPE